MPYSTTAFSNGAKPDGTQPELNENHDGATDAHGGEHNKPSAMRTRRGKTARMKSVSDRLGNLLGLTGVNHCLMGLAT
jgi:hypothetical protein